MCDIFYPANRERFEVVRVPKNLLIPGQKLYSFSVPARIKTVPVTSKTCLLLPQEGPCRGNIPMYYYSHDGQHRNGTCKIFRWGGCQGNGNRFDTAAECYDTCLTKNNIIEFPSRPRWCTLTFDYGFCFGDVERWYFDRLWKVCKKTIYSGCGGNKNNFYSKEQCDAVCRFGRGMVTVPERSDKIRNRLIVNPWNTTPKRGRDQAEISVVPPKTP
ncbi:hypothetical protein K1T71_006851 [Dendrolimus kikuchii]|uniref:Uncharacterized protein n=1 Tax=Dendrolimus kikuchii TaxID=765133 RepID=A0ACC1D266_9NEOP|nr:hypothetical protein K1T71_006851 [Dendrolimus kikuchii]